MDQAKEMAKIAFEALEDKKGEDVCAIDISAVSVLADYFVIANGNSVACFVHLFLYILNKCTYLAVAVTICN